MPITPPAVVIVLAAGEGTRMRSRLPKVLHQVCGRPLLGHVIAAAERVDATEVLVVVGHARERVTAALAEAHPAVRICVQAEQRGTGHAVRVALEQLREQGVAPAGGPVVVVAGDTPLLSEATLRQLLAEHDATGAAVTVLTADLADPAGYGRVLRDGAGLVTAIVEHKDADEATLAVTEINSGMYAFDPRFLADAITRLSTANAQGEEYLPDLIGMARAAGRVAAGVVAADADDILGINNRAQLAGVEAIMRRRINTAWMTAGVTMRDPATTYIDVGVTLAADVTLEPGTTLRGATAIDAGAVVGPDTTLIDTRVAAEARVTRVHAEGAVIGPGAVVGPFTYLRPGTHLAADTKAGAFVELKQATVAAGAKVPHLTYVGDADIGEGTNIGASCVFVNYDGEAKHRTVIGAHARVGSDTMLVAPVRVGDGAYTAAGSVIVEDVPAGALAIARGRQRNVPGWVAANRPGSASARAAGSASDELEGNNA